MDSDLMENKEQVIENKEEILADVHNTIQGLKDIGLSHKKTNEYEFDNNVYLPDYEGIYNSTIHNTGTALDDRDIDEVADAKKATPKEIWDTVDVLTQVMDGIRAGLSNTFEFGGELASAIADPWFNVAENISGEKSTPKLSEQQKQELNPFGSGETKEAESYAGALAGTAAQFGTGMAMLPIPGGAAAKGVRTLAKTTKGAKTLQAFSTVVKGLAAENIAFDENMTNFTEFVSQTFDLTPPELLAKGENAPYFMKKLKNTMDSAAAGVVIGSTFIIAKKFFPTAAVKKVGQAAIESKPAQAVIKPVEKIADKILRKQDPIGSIAREGEELVPVISKDGKKMLPKSQVEQVPVDFAESIVSHPRVLSKQEVDDVIQQALKEGTVSPEQVKGASRTVLQDVANGVIELERAAVTASKKANDIQKLLEAGKITQSEYDKRVLENFATTVRDKAIAQKTSSSIAGTAQRVASESEAVRNVNKLVEFMLENQHKIPSDKLNEMMMAITDRKKLSALVENIDGLIKKGRPADFVDKFTQVMQNIMLTSISGRLQDAVGSMSNLSLQVLDAQTAGVIGSTKQGIRTVAAKIGLASVKNETDRVFLNEAYNILHGVYSLGKETLAYNSRKLISKIQNKEFLDVSPYKKARMQAVASRQSRLGKRYGDIVLFKSESPIARLANYAFNHGGIWASERIDDLIGAYAYRGHLERSVAHDAMVKGIQNNWSRKQIGEYTREQIKKHIDFEVKDTADKVLKMSKIGTEEGMMLSRIQEAVHLAEDTTFRSDIKSPFGKWLYETANADVVKKATRLLFPFQKVGIKLAVDDYLSTRSPVALLRPNFWKDVMAGGIRQEEALSKLANGLLLQYSFYKLYEAGKITGPTPVNKNKARMLRDMGWQPFSMLNDEGEYIPLRNFTGPYEPMLKSITTMVERLGELNERVDERAGDEFTDHILVLPTLFAEAATSSAFLGDLIDNIDKGDTLGVQKFVNTMSTFGIPVVSELKELFNEEEFKQTTLTPLDAFETKWGFGETVDALDLFGEPVWAPHRKTIVGPKATSTRADYVINEMLHQRAYVQAPSAFVTKDKKSVKLDKAEVYEWQKYMSDPDINSYLEIEKLINSYNYKRAPEAEGNTYGLPTKRQLIVSKYNQLKDKAWNKLVKYNIGVQGKLIEAQILKQFPNTDERYQSTVPTLNLGK